MRNIGAINNKYVLDNKVIQNVSKFLYSDLYYLAIAFLYVLFWALGYTIGPVFLVLGLCVCLTIISMLLIVQKDVLPILPPLFSATCIISTGNLPSYFWACFIFGGIAILALVFHIIYYRNEEYKLGKLFFPLVLFAIAIMLSGIGSKLEVNAEGKWIGLLLLAICPLLVSWMMVNYSDKEKSITNYSAKTALYFGLLISMELALYYIINIDFILENPYSVPHLGWGISNTIATFLLVAFPMGFYLFAKEDSKIKSYIYLFLGVLEYVMVILTTSRGAIIFGSIEFFIAIIATAFLTKGKKRKGYIFFGIGLLIMLGLVLGLFYSKISSGFKIIFYDGMRDNGRFPLYREAIACFFQYPIFGVEFGFIGKSTYLIDATGIYQFHDTILQMVACLGIVGLISYLYYYYTKLEIIFEGINTYGIYLLIAYVGYEGYSMVNTGTIQGFPICTLIAALTVALEIDTKQLEPELYKKLLYKLKNNSGFKLNKEPTMEV